MGDRVETKERLPDEDAGGLEFTYGQRPHKGYFKNGRFFVQLPPNAGGAPPSTWEPTTQIIRWRQMEDNELYY
jgi:hypothetical protein